MLFISIWELFAHEGANLLISLKLVTAIIIISTRVLFYTIRISNWRLFGIHLTAVFLTFYMINHGFIIQIKIQEGDETENVIAYSLWRLSVLVVL